MKDYEKDVIAIHKKTIDLAIKIQEVVDEYLRTEDELLPVNDRFLVASRAVNVQAKRWCEHFHSEFNAEKYLERITNKDKLQGGIDGQRI